MAMKWENAFDIKESLNARGEKVFDVYRKDTDHMIWADIPFEGIEDFLKQMVSISERVAAEELDRMFTVENQEEIKTELKPMTVIYDRLRQYETIEEDK